MDTDGRLADSDSPQREPGKSGFYGTDGDGAHDVDIQVDGDSREQDIDGYDECGGDTSRLSRRSRDGSDGGVGSIGGAVGFGDGKQWNQELHVAADGRVADSNDQRCRPGIGEFHGAHGGGTHDVDVQVDGDGRRQHGDRHSSGYRAGSPQGDRCDIHFSAYGEQHL